MKTPARSQPRKTSTPIARRVGAPLVLCVLTATLGLGGCGGPKNFVNDNDRLREENLKLKQQVGELNEQVELRQSEVQALRQQSAGERSIKDANPPVLVKIAFNRYSGAVDTNSDGRDDLIRIYLTTLDHRDRLLPVAGRLKLQVVTIHDDKAPELLAERTWEPDEFDNAYRSSFTGYHYTLELGLPESMEPTINSVVVKATFTEAVTGHVLTEEQVVPVKTQ
jgi:hypothetical protein